ncbi:MAG: acetyl-CoA carboxylase biotin carboxyl carrier protein [Erysipelotrichaceae bacterium]|nr:acetyl-CoA carboxylase biotin carboxyl carrier protein [Erysipelotrichaceae bacterium]
MEVKELLNLFEQSSFTSFDYEDGNFKLKVSRGGSTTTNEVKVVEPAFANKAETINQPVQMAPTPAPVEAENEAISGTPVISPLVGIYYDAASPESEPFVKLNQRVEAGQTVCIIEAMKVMNEIKAPVSGVVTKINCKNEDLVEFDEEIMVIS